MVDMAHIAGLVAGGLHMSPVPYADVVTTTTHKTLRGPRGGLILCQGGARPKQINKAVFPGTQGGPLDAHHRRQGRLLGRGHASRNSRPTQEQVVKNAAGAGRRADCSRASDLVSGGTDNHLMLVDLRNMHITGKELRAPAGRGLYHRQQERHPQRPGEALCHQRRPHRHALRVTTRGLGVAEMDRIAACIYDGSDEFRRQGRRDSRRRRRNLRCSPPVSISQISS